MQAPGVVERLEYDPGRSAYIALVKYQQQQQAQQEQQQQLLAAVGSSSPAAGAWPACLLCRAVQDCR